MRIAAENSFGGTLGRNGARFMVDCYAMRSKAVRQHPVVAPQLDFIEQIVAAAEEAGVMRFAEGSEWYAAVYGGYQGPHSHGPAGDAADPSGAANVKLRNFAARGEYEVLLGVRLCVASDVKTAMEQGSLFGMQSGAGSPLLAVPMAHATIWVMGVGKGSGHIAHSLPPAGAGNSLAGVTNMHFVPQVGGPERFRGEGWSGACGAVCLPGLCAPAFAGCSCSVFTCFTCRRAG